MLSEIDGSGAAGRTIVEIVGSEYPSPTERLNTIQAVFSGPVSVRTGDAAVAEAWLKRGADIAHDPTGFRDPHYLTVVEEAGASVIVACPDGVVNPVGFLAERAAWAEAAGIARNKIVLNTKASDVGQLHGLGYALMIATGDQAEAQGVHVGAVMAGARVVASSDRQATRRTIDTVSELLERRSVERADANEVVGVR